MGRSKDPRAVDVEMTARKIELISKHILECKARGGAAEPDQPLYLAELCKELEAWFKSGGWIPNRWANKDSPSGQVKVVTQQRPAKCSE